LKLLQKNSSFNFYFNNATRNMKSIKSNQSLKLLQKNSSFNFCFKTTQLETWNQSNQSLQLLPKTLKLQFLFQQHKY
jgi:hypothetical protein